MNEEDFACDSFTPQKWRQDMCRKCYQAKKLHDKKSSSPSTPKKTTSKPSVPSLASSSSSDHTAEAEKPMQSTSQESYRQLEASSEAKITPAPTTPPRGSTSLPHRSAEASPTQALHGTATQEGTTSGTAEKSLFTSPLMAQSVMKQENIPAKPLPPAIPHHPPFSPVTMELQAPISPEAKDSKGNVASVHLKELYPSETRETEEEMACQQMVEGAVHDNSTLAICENSCVPKPCESGSFEDKEPLDNQQAEEKSSPEPVQASSAGATNSLHIAATGTSENVKGFCPTEFITNKSSEELKTKKWAETEVRATQGDCKEQESCMNQAISDISEEKTQVKEKIDSCLEPMSPEHSSSPGSSFVGDPAKEQRLPSPPPFVEVPNSPQNASSPPQILELSPSLNEAPSPPALGVPPPPLPPVMGRPPPPPPLPPLIGIPSAAPLRVRVIKPPADCGNGSPSSPGSCSPSDSEEKVAPNDLLLARGELFQSIRSGVELRPTPQPETRNPFEVKVLDVASELQQRMMKRQKAELDKAASKLESHSKTAVEIREQLYLMRGTPTYLHHLVSMMERIKTFLYTCEISVEVLEKRCRWPSDLIADLEFVLNFMDGLSARVSEVEKLCRQTMELKAQQLNVEIVERCVGEVLNKASQIQTAHDQQTRYSEPFATFPVDQIDIHRLMRRAADAISPILDRLYAKALKSEQLISDPTISKFDLNFWLQNAQRQLRMCCRMSDSLFTNLNVPRHQNYSEAMLKVAKLESQYQSRLAVLERKGNWDEDETVVLQPSQSSKRTSQQVKDETALVQQITRTLASSKELPECAFGMSEELYLRCQMTILRAAVAQDSTEAVDAFITLSTKVFTSADVKQKFAFDWLHEAVVKPSHKCVEHMVNVVGLPINCQSSDAGNSLLHIASRRQDLSTMACLVRLGANPLLVNNSSRTALGMLALKCFRPQTFPDTEIKEFPFDLSPYINNESLSDCVLVSSDGKKFPAHKLVLCAQSGVFKSMLESEHWIGSRQGNQVILPSVSSQVLKLLLQYLYTGQSVFPHDDLNLWIDLLSAADQYLLERLRVHCEKVLSGKIDNEVAVPMYWAAAQFSASRLVANCSCFILEHYHDVEDQGNKALLHLLENAVIGMRQ